jgi:hypothetical protein
MKFIRKLLCMTTSRDPIERQLGAKPPIPSPDLETLERLYRRNALQPICQLPPEILVIIFYHAQHENKAQGVRVFFASYTPKWVRVMLVCRYFRDVAVHAPMLWSVYHAKSPKAYRNLCLQRSADSILRVYGGEGTIPEIASHAHRVHTASLSYGNLNLALNIPTPQLQELEVMALAMDEFMLSSSSFGGTGARLTYLHLMGSGVVLCEQPPRLPELRQLELINFGTSLTLKPMAALLASTPSLEVLSIAHLWFDLPRPRSAWPVTIPERATLPHLKTLQVVQSALEAATLLRLIPIPGVALSISLQSSDSHDPSDLGTHHNEVYEACAAFARSVHQPEVLQQGVQKFGNVLPPDAIGNEFVIGGPYNLNDLEPGPEQPKLHLSFYCDATRSHPLTDRIETLHLLSFFRGYPSIHDFDSEVGTTYVPNLSTVVVDIRRPLAELPSLQDWVVGRGGRIEKMVFARDFLDVEIEAFMTDLRERGLASLPEVAWLP